MIQVYLNSKFKTEHYTLPPEEEENKEYVFKEGTWTDAMGTVV